MLEHPKFKKPPIIEAVVEIECDLPAKFDLLQLKDIAHEPFKEHYPKAKVQYLEEHNIEIRGSEKCEVDDWEHIDSVLESLRKLKNRIFTQSLTEKCQNLFQQ